MLRFSNLPGIRQRPGVTPQGEEGDVFKEGQEGITHQAITCGTVTVHGLSLLARGGTLGAAMLGAACTLGAATELAC